jgi:hypothetical protein
MPKKNLYNSTKNLIGYYILIILISYSSASKGQRTVSLSSQFKQYPILRDTTGKFPKEISAEGRVVDITPGTSCGVLCGCGTLKIELTKKIESYNYTDVYAAIPCFNVSEEHYLNKIIKIKLHLLEKDNHDCFWNELPINFIDSKGMPFYIPAEDTRPIILYAKSDTAEVRFIENYARRNNDTTKIYYLDSMALPSSILPLLKQKRIYYKGGDFIQLSDSEKKYISEKYYDLKSSVWEDSLIPYSKCIKNDSSGKVLTAIQNLNRSRHSKWLYLWYFSKPIFLRNNTVCLFSVMAFNGSGYHQTAFYKKDAEGKWNPWIVLGSGDW